MSSMIFLFLLLTGCAGQQQAMTNAVFKGDLSEVGSLLRSGSAAVNAPVVLDKVQPACPGQPILTPLQAAACTGQEGIVKMLLANRATIDLAAGSGQTPLVLAMANGQSTVVRMLVQAGANLESADAAGNTVLMLAAAQGDKPLVEFLLKNGASPKAKNKAGETVLLKASDPDIAKMFVDLGADPLAINAMGESGLHLTAKTWNAHMARFFLDHGVDVNLRNREGLSALDLAYANKARKIIAVIEQWVAQSLDKELESGDQAAQQGRFSEALPLYLAAVPRATAVGGSIKQDLLVKIVRCAAAMSPPPALPEKAREHLVRGSYMLKKGQDIGLVEKEMAAALRIAPWWVEGYFNLGQLQAEQKKFDQADENLRIFIAAAPSDPRAQTAKNRIIEIGVDRENEAKIGSMQGRWVDEKGREFAVSIDGDKMRINASGLVFTLVLKNDIISGSVAGASYAGDHRCTFPAQIHPVSGKVTPDARSITLEYIWSIYKSNYHCVNMMGLPSNCCLLCDEVCDSVTVGSSNPVTLQLRPAF